MTTVTVTCKRRMKVFNKVLSEMLVDYNKTFQSDKFMRIKNIEEINAYHDEVKSLLDDFINCKSVVFEKVSLLKKLNIGPHFTPANEKIVWDYLTNLFIVSFSDSSAAQSMQDSITNQRTEIAQTVTASTSNSLLSMVDSVTKELSTELEGKDSDITPMDLITGIMSGNTNIKGVNFGPIISNMYDSLQSKIQTGEINLEQLKGLTKFQ